MSGTTITSCMKLSSAQNVSMNGKLILDGEFEKRIDNEKAGDTLRLWKD